LPGGLPTRFDLCFYRAARRDINVNQPVKAPLRETRRAFREECDKGLQANASRARSGYAPLLALCGHGLLRTEGYIYFGVTDDVGAVSIRMGYVKTFAHQ
jgi:hypothetical protein